MSELLVNGPDKASRLKAIIDRLAAGESPAAVKREFHELIKGADALEVAAMEQSLIEGGLPVEEVQRLCEVHADVFREGLERGGSVRKMPGHPVHTYMEENRAALRLIGPLAAASFWGGADAVARAADALRPIVIHYTRKENQLFPFLEKAGFTGPSKVMWGKHDELRARFKSLAEAAASGDARRTRAEGRALARQLRMMIFMEERILFPNALKRLTDADWAAVRRGEDAIGFAWVKPGSVYDAGLVPGARAPSGSGSHLQAAIAALDDAKEASGGLRLSEGSLPVGVLDLMLKNLPLDVSFVDADDKVRYYSDSPHRVFPRSPGVIGRDVRNCHPHKSVATVERILEAFKKKEKDSAEFWLEVGGRFVVISYKALYGGDGAYLGTMEISMDATDIRALEGRRTLLDW